MSTGIGGGSLADKQDFGFCSASLRNSTAGSTAAGSFARFSARRGRAIKWAMVSRPVPDDFEMLAESRLLDHSSGVSAHQHRLAGGECMVVIPRATIKNLGALVLTRSRSSCCAEQTGGIAMQYRVKMEWKQEDDSIATAELGQVECGCHQSDRGGLEGQNVAANPCPPTKDYPLLRSADRLFSVENTSRQRQRAVQNCSLFALEGDYVDSQADFLVGAANSISFPRSTPALWV